MRNLILSIILLGSIWGIQAQNPQKALDSLQSLVKSSQNDSNRVVILNTISEFMINTDSYDSATYYAEMAKTLGERINFKAGTCVALRLTGISFTCQGEYSKSLTYLFQALKIAESINNRQLIGKIYNSLGSNFSLQGDYLTALDYFYKSIEFYYNPIIYSDIARCYHFQGKYPLAIKFYKKTLEADVPKIDRAYILNDLGDIYENEGNLNLALSHYFQALSIADSLDNLVAICDISGSLGFLMKKMGRLQQAIYYQSNSLKISQSINSRYVIWQSAQTLSEIYELLGNTNQALRYHKLYVQVRDSLYNEENIKHSVTEQMNFKFDKQQAIDKAEQEKKDALAKEELKRKQTERNSFLIICIVVLIFSIFIFRALKRNQKANKIIAEQKKLVEISAKDTTQNIQYAKRIQDAIMPSSTRISELFPKSFIFNRGRDIVSGDFYFSEKVSEDKIIFAVADSTSHGVSGSMMSMLNSNLLNEAVRNGIYIPSKILDYVNMALARAFHQTGEDKEIKDGMDICLCSLNTKTMVLEFSGAYNPLIIIRNKEVIELDPDKLQLGQATQNYSNQEFQLCEGDMIFLSSDGYPDQFGGPKDKKYKYKNFIALLSKISESSIDEQRAQIIEEFDKWRGNNHQTDDILVFGIKI